MPKFTKNAIKNSFMKLLNTTPFDNITVKNIVDDCGINRNTFYYNFEDIYALVDEILQDEISRIVEKHEPYRSWNDALLYAADFALQNKTAIFNLHNSSKRGQVKKYMQKVINEVVHEFVNHEAEGSEASSEDISFIADFYSCALLGILEKWLDDGMQGDFETIIRRTSILFDSNIKQAIGAIAKTDNSDV